MIFRATEWMSGRWWAALAIAMAFILVARTGTVGAPAEARTADRADRPMTRRFAQSDTRAAGYHSRSESATERAHLSLERHVRYLEGELSALQGELELERQRAEILESSYSALETKFDAVTSSVRQIIESDTSGTASVPQPIEAIYTRGLDESAVTKTSQER